MEQERDELSRQQEQLMSRSQALEESLRDREEQMAKVRAEARERMNRADLRLLTGIIEMHESLLQFAPEALDSDIQEQVHSVFASLNLRQIPTVGRPFDSELHTVFDTVYSTDYKDSTVISEKSCGYEASGVVVKKADVVISRDPFWCTACASFSWRRKPLFAMFAEASCWRQPLTS